MLITLGFLAILLALGMAIAAVLGLVAHGLKLLTIYLLERIQIMGT